MLKATLLLISALLFALGILPPRKKVKDSGSAQVYRGQKFEYVVRSFAYISCVLILVLVCNAAVLLLQDAPHIPLTSGIAHAICPSAPYVTALPVHTFSSGFHDLHPRFLAGLVFVWVGALLRLWSYHTLGELFTFEVLVTPDHRLITSGPYAHVRHPSYTGIALLLLGVQLMQFGPGGYISACHSGAPAYLHPLARVVGSTTIWVARSWQLASAYVLVSLGRRCRIEDRELSRKFGDAWVQYANTVPYRLIPFVL
ncbi:hypothetical protein K466DRAFT_542025 [Polyporus arcularius HHB13444]|uniref:Protein-S-isoprenylcysteine O-methyltransferase n=1 Tax=Polyporus arcularius HHB13444 TaxID=1314778 RepID=A0A5C3PQ89_9APHY|nr:hypothetical protein K466DRAFT_542025 [Polyporus arcularius HHB13444]